MSETTEAADGAQFEFDQSFQEKIAALILRDTGFARRAVDLVRPEYFTDVATGAVVRVVLEHVKVYKQVPDIKILPTILKDEIAGKRIRNDLVPGIRNIVRSALKADLSNPEYVAGKVKDFAKHQAIEQAMISSLPLLEKKDWAGIERIMRSAQLVGEVEDGEDYDYYKEIVSRTKKREDLMAGGLIKTGITTGYAEIDAELYHGGWGRRELSCLMGPAKSGKSLALGDFAKNASLAGYSVLYVSLEVSKEIIAERIDAALTDTRMVDLAKSSATLKTQIETIEKRAGPLHFRDFASGTMKASHLDRVIEDYRSRGIIFDLVCVDYADIMAPEHSDVELREALRTIYIDLRALAFKWNCAMLTATQTNRNGAKAHTGEATDVGDDWNKARTVDILLGLNATPEEVQAGRARIYWALSRNSRSGFTITINQDRSRMKFLTKVISSTASSVSGAPVRPTSGLPPIGAAPATAPAPGATT